MSGRTCILVPVYYPYRWLAPFMQRCLDEFWQDHPPVFFCGLEADDVGALLTLPLREPALPRDWTKFVRDAVTEVTNRGFETCYLILEEHLPLALCHARHLNTTLPKLLDQLAGAYIGLMGWDNRRFSTRAPVLDAASYRLMHLTTPDAPRFHLHPSLWRLDALRDCLALALEDSIHTPWRFEKVTEKHDAALPARWRNGCYQVCGSAMSANPMNALMQRIERFIFLRLMAIYPLLPAGRMADGYWRTIGFDNFFYNGPYPMFFSGVMVKGKLNPYFAKYITGQTDRDALWEALLATHP